MSLSCLTCQPSPNMSPYGDSPGYQCCAGLNRSWSGGLSPLPYSYLERSQSTKAKLDVNNKGHRKMYGTSSPLMDVNTRAATTVTDEPRLMRSGGMRRDWSFENLQNRAIATRKK